MVVALIFAALVVVVGITAFFTSEPDPRLTREQEGRIHRDNQLRAAYGEFFTLYGRYPSVKELWLYSPPPEKDSHYTQPEEAT